MLEAPVAHSRHLRGAAANLNVDILDENGEPADASGTLTVGITKADGTELLAAGSSTTNPTGTGSYTRALTVAQTATLDILTATWTDSTDSSTLITVHEIVGGYYFTLAEARAADATLADAARHDDTGLQATRRDVEEEFEAICAVAFVPRYRRVRLDGDGTARLLIPDPLPRTLRSVRVYSDATTYTSFTAAEIAAVTLPSNGVIERTDGGVWAYGRQNLVLEYEHGHDRPPAEIKRAAIARARQRLRLGNSGLPDRTETFTSNEFGAFRLATAGRDRVGTDWIDAALARHSERIPGLA